jgi:hypothetical protein
VERGVGRDPPGLQKETKEKQRLVSGRRIILPQPTRFGVTDRFAGA